MMTLTVLFADDDAALRGPLAAFLRKQGFHVLEAEDGNEALEVARKYDGPIHLLVSDILMPNMDGTAVAALLSAARPEMRILLISGFADDLVCQKDWASSGSPSAPRNCWPPCSPCWDGTGREPPGSRRTGTASQHPGKNG